MSSFRLKIVTPDKKEFDGEAESIVVRTVNGDVCILPGHTDYIAPLGIGRMKFKSNIEERRGFCTGGTLVVTGGEVTVFAENIEWED